MIEEFMLLANMQVAQQISKAFPDIALLRRHPTPLATRLGEFEAICRSLGLADKSVDLSKPGKFSESLEIIISKCSSEAQKYAVEMLCTKSMQLAKYFCTGSIDPAAWHHFALNVSHYTHFTSPIRRYADVIVHRLLQASLSIEQTNVIEEQKKIMSSLPERKALDRICTQCNTKKVNAQRAEESSDRIYLSLYFRAHPLEAKGVIIFVGKDHITCLVPSMGINSEIFYEDIEGAKKISKKDAILWDGDSTQELQLLTEVDVLVCAHEKELNIMMKLLPPRKGS